MDQLNKTSYPTGKKRRATRRRVNDDRADASAMPALVAGMPGRSLRRLSQNKTLPQTPETVEALQKLHPQSRIPRVFDHSVSQAPPTSL